MKKRMLIVSGLVALILLLTPIIAFADAPTITVTGSATVTMKPEVATIRLGVSEQSETVLDGQQKCNKTISAIVEAMRAKGVADSDISVGYLSIYTNYNYDTVPYQVIGYNASHQLVIKTTEVEKAGELIDAALEAGANQVDGIEFGPLDNSEAYKKALSLAIQNATEKAQFIAAGYGKVVDEMKEMTEDGYAYGGVPGGMYAKMENDAGGGTHVLTGELEVTATINVQYTLKDAQ